MRALIRGLALLALFAVATARAADLPPPWVEFASDRALEVRSIVAPGMNRPKVVADGSAVRSETRGAADTNCPLRVCVAHATASAHAITVDGLPMAVVPGDVKRIVVIGDTGCRLKGAFTQDCNDPVKWRFAVVARLATARRPDLVIHVGDYHYRATPCPDAQPGCAGSPHGDNWDSWAADFFTPAKPLLQKAPWIVVRGNHENCERGGVGYARLLDPSPATGPQPACVEMMDQYTIMVGGRRMVAPRRL